MLSMYYEYHFIIFCNKVRLLSTTDRQWWRLQSSILYLYFSLLGGILLGMQHISF